MNLFHSFHQKILHALQTLQQRGVIKAAGEFSKITCEPPKDSQHGDMATNAAMVLAPYAEHPPRKIAQEIAALLSLDPDIEDVSIAGPGFVNLKLRPQVWQEQLNHIFASGTDYGNSSIGHDHSVHIEFVSANPTGPLHAGHARIAVVGDVVARLLKKAGFRVTKEYYINDGGSQVDTLARSLYLRYKEACGLVIDQIPEGLYPGEYLIPVGQHIAHQSGKQWLDKNEEDWLPTFRQTAVDHMMILIRKDLEAAGVHFDVFTSEQDFIQSKKVDRMIESLEKEGLVYKGILPPPKGIDAQEWETKPQLLFKATAFGDDIDRPLTKTDGTWTYFATDIAYHHDKLTRYPGLLMNVWGADHIGYVTRMKAAVQAITKKKDSLQVLICQLVNLMENGEALKMSKRSGNFVTLRHILEEVGKDALRFMMMMRKNDIPLDFDFSKIKECSKDNPVFYVNYAYARCTSVLKQGREAGISADSATTLEALRATQELAVMKKLAEWPRIIEMAAALHEPQKIALYLYDLSNLFHILWHQGKQEADLRFIQSNNLSLSQARLKLIQCVRIVIASGFSVLGITPLEEMFH